MIYLSEGKTYKIKFLNPAKSYELTIKVNSTEIHYKIINAYNTEDFRFKMISHDVLLGELWVEVYINNKKFGISNIDAILTAQIACNFTNESQDVELVMVEYKKEIRKCICPLSDLMNVGCKCGAMSAERSK